jgi:FkbM family methyltransferase
MGEKSGVAAMKFEHSPDRERATHILRQLVQTPITCAPRQVDKPLVLYGAGNLGRMARQYFERIAVPVERVVDANAQLHRGDPFWAGVHIVSPTEVLPGERSTSLLAVCVATASFSRLSEELGSQGWTDMVPFYDIAEAYRDRHPLGNGWFAGQLDQTDTDNIETVLSGWQDDISRAHHLQFIAWHTLREDWLFDDAPVTTDDRYFIPEVLSLLGGDEIFCDLGAHHAEVILRFLQIAGNRFKEIWAIEPDKENHALLCGELQKLDAQIRQKIHTLPCVLGAQSVRGNFFHGLGYASQLSELGKHSVEVKAFDQLGIAPTFLKLHLEGWELDALKGSLQTLQTHRPIVAATTYHNRQGLWELPQWIMTMLPDYRFLFRLHSWCGTGAVIYGIPGERCCVQKKATRGQL